MNLDGYISKPVLQFETASGFTAVRCPAAQCTAAFIHKGEPGWHTLKIRYFDYAQGSAKFRLYAANQLIDEWIAGDTLPTRRTEPDGTSSTRRVVPGIALRPGDEIRIEGFPDNSEDAALDYVEVLYGKE
jgi:hypothetical protein